MHDNSDIEQSEWSVLQDFNHLQMLLAADQKSVVLLHKVKGFADNIANSNVNSHQVI